MDQNEIMTAKQYIDTALVSLKSAKKILQQAAGDTTSAPEESTPQVSTDAKLNEPTMTPQGKIVEGVFDGQNMIGPDGKQYSVPANYASKSKLIEGDVLKLTISPDGSFIYKQIGPIERERVIGVLSQDQDTDKYYVLSEGKSYKILLASVTYFKGEVGDEVVILVPKGKKSEWAAVENIIKNIPGMPPQTLLEAGEKGTLEEIPAEEVVTSTEESTPTEEAIQEESPEVMPEQRNEDPEETDATKEEEKPLEEI